MYCHCGCGQHAPLHTRTNARKGFVKGHPAKWVIGHTMTEARGEAHGAAFKIDGVPCRLIGLTKGLYAIVCEVDYAALTAFNWYAARARETASYYAFRNPRKSAGEKGIVRMHRQIIGLMRGDPLEPDHWNGSGLDNRRSNLRVSTRAENAHNSRLRRNSRSGLKGAEYRKDTGLWRARVVVNGKCVFDKTFASALEAHRAYRVEAVKYHGEFARLA